MEIILCMLGNEAMNNTSNCLEVIQLRPYFSSYIYIYIYIYLFIYKFTEFSDLKEKRKKKHTHTGCKEILPN